MIKKVICALTFSSILGCQLPGNSLNTNSIIQDNLSPQKNLIVRFKENINISQINKINKDIGINKVENISKDLNIFEIKTNSIEQFNTIKSKYDKSNLTQYVEGDGKLSLPHYSLSQSTNNLSFSAKDGGTKPNDNFYGLQWNAKTIDADRAWTITTGNKNILVAVIDSGVDPNHPDLVDNLLPMVDMLTDSGESDIYKFGFNEIDYSGKDGNGHGTHVTGILGAMINNGIGIAGIAGNIKILPIKAANYEGNTSASIIAKSILKAIDSNVRVINLSIGGPKSEGTQALKDSVELAISKGIVFVSATGNESDRRNGVVTEITVPAAYPGVISVAATTKFNKVANYSNGGEEAEIAAPGGGGTAAEGDKIYSTWPTYKTYEGYRAGIIGPYATLSGTSMSCPHVSAAAALILTREPNLTGQQVRLRLLSTTTDVEASGFDNSTGFGKLNVYKALISNTHDKKVIE